MWGPRQARRAVFDDPWYRGCGGAGKVGFWMKTCNYLSECTRVADLHQRAMPSGGKPCRRREVLLGGGTELEGPRWGAGWHDGGVARGVNWGFTLEAGLGRLITFMTPLLTRGLFPSWYPVWGGWRVVVFRFRSRLTPKQIRRVVIETAANEVFLLCQPKRYVEPCPRVAHCGVFHIHCNNLAAGHPHGLVAVVDHDGQLGPGADLAVDLDGRCHTVAFNGRKL